MKKPAAAGRKPNSVPFHSAPFGASLRVTIIPLAPPLLVGSSSLPGDLGRAVLNVSLFGLAPCGVLPATGVATGAVRSYRTFSPLPPVRPDRRCVFCATSPSSCPDRELPGALPCGVRTFLSPSRQGAMAGDRLAHCGGESIIGHQLPIINGPRCSTDY